MMICLGNTAIIDIKKDTDNALIYIEKLKYNQSIINLFNVPTQKVIFIPFYYDNIKAIWKTYK